MNEADKLNKPIQHHDPDAKHKGLLAGLSRRLARTGQSIVGQVQSLIRRRPVVDAEFLCELEAILLQADVGVNTTERLLSGLSRALKEGRQGQALSGEDVLKRLKEQIVEVLGPPEPLGKAVEGPTVIMVVGVNGTGKTTTVGKLCHRFRTRGAEVILGATDTFRAAAIDQLEIWGERTGARVIRHEEGGDPAAVAYDACQAAKARGVDYVILDTAGRLHTHVNLMRELEKVKRVVEREVPGAPHEVLLVLDATSGQNGLSQAARFEEAVEVTGIALTKLDGTAKGGIILAIRNSLGIPVKLIGIGEGTEDLRDFDPKEFADAIFYNQDT
ncbi:MAG: signal recognition particle-docking protein FtsY [Firmicutes bacterium]|jgi:fused signal recognition particle receptor|nr:signal recognition particle-docking protein FtsY [Bacillota bacterium]